MTVKVSKLSLHTKLRENYSNTNNRSTIRHKINTKYQLYRYYIGLVYQKFT